MSLLDAATKAELTALYRVPDRHYHGIGHIEALLALLDAHHAAFADPEAVEAAVWFHDAIYDSRRKDNETASAVLAADRLRGHVEAARLDRIVAMIEATAIHQVPDFEDEAAQQDAALFLDMDLSILGAPAKVFDAYEAAVRREYGWVSETDWRAGRAAVLRNFLARPRIFHSVILGERFELPARENLSRSLDRLAGTA